MKASGVISRMLAVWAETDLVLADEFRDGNVPAHDGAVERGAAGFCGSAAAR